VHHRTGIAVTLHAAIVHENWNVPVMRRRANLCYDIAMKGARLIRIIFALKCGALIGLSLVVDNLGFDLFALMLAIADALVVRAYSA
jgi:hypothetical protein